MGAEPDLSRTAERLWYDFQDRPVEPDSKEAIQAAMRGAVVRAFNLELSDANSPLRRLDKLDREHELTEISRQVFGCLDDRLSQLVSYVKRYGVDT